MREAAARRAPPQLLGKILYLGTARRELRRLQGAQRPDAVCRPGELRCIIGPNGAGKTTMMDVITGKTGPTRAVPWFGQDVNLLELREPQIAQRASAASSRKPTVFEQLDRVREPRIWRWRACGRSGTCCSRA
jgi:ABC-type uncharacterized transport system ATPase subunit